MTEELQAFEDAVIVQAPPGAVVVGASISPDGKYGVALTLLPSARDYPMDDLFERVGNRWLDAGGGSGTGISWSSMSEDGSNGVLRYGDEARRVPPRRGSPTKGKRSRFLCTTATSYSSRGTRITTKIHGSCGSSRPSSGCPRRARRSGDIPAGAPRPGAA